jgi:peptidoglycan pentaglycine glycine transferase (the first glycine)
MYDSQAHYVFAGSSNDFRKIAPAYTVIWRAMQEAKQRGCTLFNFGGVTDTVKGQDLSGVTGFKKRFGGYQADHQNPADLIYQPLKYFAFRLYKTIR